MSARGAHGGYWLARPAEEISMDEVVQALEGSIAPMECFVHDHTERVLCSHEPDAGRGCATKLLWTRVQGGIIRSLQTTTLAELVEFSRRNEREPTARRRKETTREMEMADLEIRNLHVRAGEKEILRGLDLTVDKGEIHALMGPNGSGKSTLANAIMGHPNLEVTEGQILFKGEDVTEAAPDERARMGLFMAFQYPVSVPGVTVTKYLRTVLNAHREARGEEPIPLKEFRQTVEAAMKLTNVPKEFSSRYLNEGFSGGEKKRMEILQLALQRPELAILDETDSGLDIDALRVVANGVNAVAGPDMGVLIITHYQRILHLVQPSHVHVMYQGRIVKRGRAGAGRRARGEGLRLDHRRARGGWLMSATRRGAARRRRRVPGPAPGLRRTPADVPGLERDLADAAAGDRRDDPVLHRVARVDPPRRVPARGRGDRPLRGRAAADRRLARLDARGDDLHRQRDRRDQPRRVHVGPPERRPRRPGRADRDGAPLEHRPVADPLPGPRGRARVRAGARRRPARPRRARRAARRAARSSSRVVHVSNVRRHDQPGRRDRRGARTTAGAVVLVDGTQAVPQIPVDLRELDADFYAWTGHKAYGPTGIGVLHGRRALLEEMPPFIGGGHMIRHGRRERIDVDRPAVEVRGRAPPRSPRRSGSGPRSTGSGRSGSSRSARTRSRSSPTRSSGLAQRSPGWRSTGRRPRPIAAR